MLDGYVVFALAGLLIGVILGFIVYRRRSNEVCEFPLFVVPKRLGAEHAAGVGAVIVFQNPQVSPSAQRSGEGDFLSEM